MSFLRCYHSVIYFILMILLATLGLSGCDDRPLNNPYPRAEDDANILYSSFSEPPKTLDPAKSYSSNEYIFIAQIYEPPLQYDYLKRPYTLIPLTATSMPTQQYLDEKGQVLPANVSFDKVAYTDYIIEIKPDIYYQPHPAFAKDEKGRYYYQQLPLGWLAENNIRSLKDFPQQGTRELIAEDYVYQIKRLAHPEVQSPILGFMSEYIVGLHDYAQQLQQLYVPKNGERTKPFLDLRKFPLAGAEVLDRYRFKIRIKGYYPQFIYWLAMPFFSPIPWEADQFDSQPKMEDHNITLNWYPVGTGPFMLSENNPNQRMVLTRNPNFHGENYPLVGEPEDKSRGLLDNAGKPLPFIDQAMFYLEKESIPRWHKFLQGYYDNSGISADNFQQAIEIDSQDQPQLSESMQKMGMRLQIAVEPSISYLGFNMLDDVVGGNSERARKLRQAIAIAIDYEEFIAIFANGRGTPAHSPLPPGIYGYESERNNPYVYEEKNGRVKRKSVSDAKKILAEAGYANGQDPSTGAPLKLYYDLPAMSGPDDKAQLDWMRKQFAKLGIELDIRATQYNRFQEKMRTGHAQLFAWGWNADYPDPENFLFLLYGPNGKVKSGGENAANYQNAQFDRLYEKMKQMPNNEERLMVIRQMLAIIQRDTPWVWGFFPKTFVLSHGWNHITKPNAIANNTLKYVKIDPKLRAEKRREWNQPIIWPFVILVLLFLIFVLVIFRYYRQMEYRPLLRRKF